MKCKHQFFETNKEQYVEPYDCECKTNIEIVHYHIATPSKYGVRVVCALCEERRRVWQDGTINIYNKKKGIWV